MKAAHLMHTQPWRLLGQRLDPEDAPMCWQWWANELLAVEAKIQREDMAKAIGH